MPRISSGTSAAALVLCLLATSLLLTTPQEARAITPEEIKVVARELVCLCGTCNRESLATCTCTEFAVPQREVIGAALEAGKTKDEIVADFVSRYGQMMLASPPQKGTNSWPGSPPLLPCSWGLPWCGQYCSDGAGIPRSHSPCPPLLGPRATTSGSNRN